MDYENFSTSLTYNYLYSYNNHIIKKLFLIRSFFLSNRLKRSKIRVILGDHDQTVITDSESVMRAVSSIVRHRHFDVNSYNHDIALLKLRKPVNFSKTIRPVCLPTEGKN